MYGIKPELKYFGKISWTNYSIYGLKRGITYQFAVVASNSVGGGNFSNIITFTIPSSSTTTTTATQVSPSTSNSVQTSPNQNESSSASSTQPIDISTTPISFFGVLCAISFLIILNRRKKLQK